MAELIRSDKDSTLKFPKSNPVNGVIKDSKAILGRANDKSW